MAAGDGAMSGHLIHVGCPKAGSTFLQRWFAAHPGLDYAEGGIAGFRDVYQIAALAAVPSAPGRCRVTSSEELTAPRPNLGRTQVDYESGGETGIKGGQSRACAMLAALFPGARILLVTRGFSSVILSSYSQYVRTGGTEDLETLLAEGRDSPWDYDHLIGLYERAFGADQLIILPWELLRDDPSSFLDEIEQRLGLESFPWTSCRPNASLSAAEMRWYPRLGRRLLSLPLPGRLRQRLFRLYLRGALRNRLASPIALLQRFRPAPPVTAALIGDQALDEFRGKAEKLRSLPLYAPYAGDYLL